MTDKYNNLVSVMMVTYNRLPLTKQTFDTTLKNTGIDYNLIIVDNNSQDETVAYIRNICCNKKIYNITNAYIDVLKENKGIAYGRNLCLKINHEFYQSKYLCTLDNDVILPTDWLKKCCTVLDSNQMIGACGVNLEGDNVKYSKTNVGGEPIQIKMKGNLGTAAMVYRYEYFSKLGYFENYKMYGHEDALMGYKIRQMGNKQLVYLEENGIHLGIGNEDSGEYREMKNKYWDINMQLFEKDIRDISNGRKRLYTEFTDYNQSFSDYILVG